MTLTYSTLDINASSRQTTLNVFAPKSVVVHKPVLHHSKFWLDQRSDFCNKNGSVRLQILRDQIHLFDLNTADGRRRAECAYADFVTDDESMVFDIQKTTQRFLPHIHHTSDVFGDAVRIREAPEALVEHHTLALKARKRGNDVDQRRTERNFKGIYHRLKDFARKDKDDVWLKPLKTRLIYVTLTLDPLLTNSHFNPGGDRVVTLQMIGRLYNNFLSRARRAFGSPGPVRLTKKGKIGRSKIIPTKIRQIHSFEVTDDYGIHIHALLAVEDYAFKAFQHQNRMTGAYEWRVQEQPTIVDCWPYGFVDVFAVKAGNTAGRIKDVLWYITKDVMTLDYRAVEDWGVEKTHRKLMKTRAALFLHRKRAYAMSKSLQTPKVSDPGTVDLIRQSYSISQNTFGGGYIKVVEQKMTFLGLVRHLHAPDLHSDVDTQFFDHPPNWVLMVHKPRIMKERGSALSGSWGN